MKKLTRSLDDRKISGVCGGLAEYFNIDATVIRLIFTIFLVIFVGTPILFYLLCAVIIPEQLN